MISVDCVWDEYEETECSVPCGGGTKTVSGKGTPPVYNGGAECPRTNITKPCNTHACPNNGRAFKSSL